MVERSLLQKLIWLRGSPVSGGASWQTAGPADILTFEAKAKPVQALSVGVLPAQSGSGDPSPDNIRPISGWTGANIYRTGKNLLKLVESEMVTTGWNRVFPITVKAGTYIISCQNKFGASTKGANVSLTDENDTNIVTQLNSGYAFGDSVFVGVAKTISEEDAARIKNIRFACRANDATYSSIVDGNIQLELGSTASDYSAYSGATYPVTWQSEAGTVYGGTLDVLTGELTVTHVKKTISAFDGVFGATSNGYCVYKVFSDTTHFPTETGKAAMLSNVFKYSNQNNSNMPLMSYGGQVGVVSTQSFILPSTVTNLTEANTWLSDLGTPLDCVFTLAASQTFTLTPEQLSTLAGQNVLWCDAGQTTVTYFGKPWSP